MIGKNEILKMATDLDLRPETIEKDYVLGWILWGINRHPAVSRWAFKGGTSLKKCHFETFRFSEDLDFTLTNPLDIRIQFLTQAFGDITERISKEVGIEFVGDRMKFKTMDKGHGRFSAQGKVYFNGPLRRKQSVASVKLDLTTDELLVLDTITKEVHHPYSDRPDSGIKVDCYAFEEVVAEKIRALAQRARPRDLYDVVHFYRNREMIKNPKLVYSVLKEKCAFKKIEVPTYESIGEHEKLDELAPQWVNMLAHQLPSLPPMESFWAVLPDFFKWLAGLTVVRTIEPLPYKTGEVVYQPGRISGAFSIQPFLRRIQFAAANRVCVALRYHGRGRTVEPLSFRTSQTGNRLFYGYEREASHVKAYSLSKIESVGVTSTSYIAAYPVEISGSGPISMPQVRRR